MAWALKIDCPMDVQGALLRLSYMSDETGALVTREKLLRRKFGEQAESSIRLMLNYLVQVGALTKATIQGAHEGLRLQLRMDEDPDKISERIIENGGIHASRPRRKTVNPSPTPPNIPADYSADTNGAISDIPADYSAQPAPSGLPEYVATETNNNLRYLHAPPIVPPAAAVNAAEMGSTLVDLVDGEWVEKWMLSEADVSELINVFRHKFMGDDDAEQHIRRTLASFVEQEQDWARQRCQNNGRRPVPPRSLQAKAAEYLDRHIARLPKRQGRVYAPASNGDWQFRHLSPAQIEQVSKYTGVVAE